MPTRAFSWDSIPLITKASADPAAAASAMHVITVPAGKRWLFYGMRFQLVTSAVAGNRLVDCRVSVDGVDYIHYAVTTNVQTASLTHNYKIITNFSRTETFAGINHTVGFAVGDDSIELPAGGTILTYIVSGGDAGDNAGVASMYIREAPA